MLFKPSQIETAETTKKSKSGAMTDTNRQEAKLCRAEQALAEAMPKLERNTTTHFLTAGAWALHDLVRHIVRQTGPAHLIGFTWSITEPAVRQLVKMRNEGDILSMSLIIDTAMSKWSRAACLFAQNNALDFRTTPIHAKGFLITNDEWSVSVISSANFSNNPRIEAGVITDNPDIYNFHREWIDPTIKGADVFSGQPDLFPPEEQEKPRSMSVYMRSPGSGVHHLSDTGTKDAPFFDVDSFFVRNDVYEYNSDGLELATEWARSEVLEAAAQKTQTISIAGITHKTLPAIETIAKRYGYTIHRYEETK